MGSDHARLPALIQPLDVLDEAPLGTDLLQSAPQRTEVNCVICLANVKAEHIEFLMACLGIMDHIDHLGNGSVNLSPSQEAILFGPEYALPQGFLLEATGQDALRKLQQDRDQCDGTPVGRVTRVFGRLHECVDLRILQCRRYVFAIEQCVV